MPREVTDASDITWTCIQAFAGLGADAEKAEAAQVKGAPDRVYVVCTPSGGAHSVRVALPAAWEAEVTDEDLLRAIRAEFDREG